LNDALLAVEFSPQGDVLIVGGQEGRARWLSWRADVLQREACANLSSNLSKEEWRQYVPEVDFHRTCTNLP
jgi:hypothetical protein